ncbi:MULTISPECIES: SMP-30/gluconolactonase/LRE family protein [Asaia]|uniref:SMP-30/gluconolactonase/LRE family protein n=1 Tax=Asaia TaxID=91914 RepID=UPI002553E618|nr:L-dopachrome tautomerase-related protein [Asaia sp. HumB]MDL2171743.1 L-dopachrome tautomerase-related protein [Asaia sp. HumB]
MKRRSFLSAASVAPLLGVAGPAFASGNADDGTSSSGEFDIVAKFVGPGPSGVAVLPDGRMFVSFPRHADNHAGATLGEVKGGVVMPYPSAELSLPSDRAPADRLMSVHGIAHDSAGRLWVIDDGKLAGHDIPEGAAKIVCIDPVSNRVTHKIPLKSPVMLPNSHMNDLRVALSVGAKGTVFVTDSSFGDEPAMIVADIATGQTKRVLVHHVSTQAVPGFMAIVEGEPRRYVPHHPQMVSGGADGIALLPDESRLYYAPLTSRRLYSIPTRTLADQSLSDEALAAQIRDEGEKGTADGLCFDQHGRLYTTNYEHDCILRRDPDGSFAMAVRDARILSPDGICATRDWIYCTLGQWNRLPSFNEGHNRREPPYLLIRFPVEPLTPLDALPASSQRQGFSNAAATPVVR